MLRCDLLSAVSPGNKYYKLYYNLRNAIQAEVNAVVSFGGPWSNHLHALAATGQTLGINTVGIIRGHPGKELSPCLRDVQAWGMRLFWLDKKHYRDKAIEQILPILKKDYGNYHLIPEGGSNLAGVRGCIALGQGIARHLGNDDTYSVCLAAGTAATLAGVTLGSPANARCLGFSVLKGNNQLTSSVQRWFSVTGEPQADWQIIEGYARKGYGKVDGELLSWMQGFEESNQLALDPVYTAKMLMGVEQMARAGYWKEGSRIVVIHTGGTQGRRGFIGQHDG